MHAWLQRGVGPRSRTYLIDLRCGFMGGDFADAPLHQCYLAVSRSQPLPTMTWNAAFRGRYPPGRADLRRGRLGLS